MKWLHIDSTGGASGDMLLGALAALGVDMDCIQTALTSLPVEDIHVHIDTAQDGGITGIRATVHAHEHHTHHHKHDHAHNHAHEHGPSRNLHDITHIIEHADLPVPVKTMSCEVFHKIAVAEAKIHGTTVDKIHFHEVGALDSIADIVGCCLGLHKLDVSGVSVSPLPMGHGTITCAHGVYPNPAPATVELLRGMRIVAVDEPHELVTPTGAALLATWKTAEAPPAGSLVGVAGYGLGQRKLDSRPNVLRAVLYESAPSSHDATPATCLSLACNLDDTSPELIGELTRTLFEKGALDVFVSAIQMKKQRPGSLLTVLCRVEDRDTMLDLIFTESTTFGVRETQVQRALLERRTEEIQTPYGPVRIKIGRWKGRDVTRMPEMDDCIARAREHQVPVRHVYEAAR